MRKDCCTDEWNESEKSIDVFFFSMEGDSSPKLISSFCFTFVRRYLLCKFIMLAINYSINRAEPKGKTFSYFSFLKFHYKDAVLLQHHASIFYYNERDILDCTFCTTLISANTVYTPSEKYSPVARGKRFKWKNMATFIYARGKRRVELTYSYICVYIYIPRVIRKKLQIILFYNSRDWANEISFPRVIEKFFLKYHNAFNKSRRIICR